MIWNINLSVRKINVISIEIFKNINFSSFFLFTSIYLITNNLSYLLL